ncbi:MAG: biosynthetic peptidoglycan transglycosylase [Minicystis sp.]
MISRRFKLALASGCIVGATVVTGFGPVVRYNAGRAAERYGAGVSIEQVLPALGGVRLRNVDVTLEEVPSARIHLDEVVVAYGTSGRNVTLRGGVISAIGPRETVIRQVEAWRAHHLAAGESGGRAESGGGRTTDLSGLRIRWQDTEENPSEVLSAADLRFTREGGRLSVAAGEASATLGKATVSVKNGRVELVRPAEGGGYRLAAMATDSVEAEVTLPVGKGGAIKELGLRPAKADPAVDAPAEKAAGPGAALRKSLLSAAKALDLFLDPAAKVRLGGVHARIHHASDVLNLGPGTLDVARADGRMVIELTPDLRGPGARPATTAAPVGSAAAPAADREETLTFRLAVPLAEGGTSAAQEIVADVQGGPIWLSSLGVREGDFGLFDVGLTSLSTRSHLVLSAEGRTLNVDGEGKVHALSLRSAALSDEPVAGLELAFRLKGEIDLDGSRARIAEGELDLGAIRLIVKGDYDRVKGGRTVASAPAPRRGREAVIGMAVGETTPAVTGSEDTYRIRGSFDMPLTACQSMLDATPKGLVPKLQGMRMAGSFALRGKADIDTAHLDRGFRLEWDASSSCRVTEAPAAIHVERFKKAFHRTAYDGEGKPVDIETGPGTPDWVPYAAISKFMEAAVLTTEDGGFHRHHGFDHEAIKNSVRENLRKKKFVRGASTISMQLAKNLYLDRGKNLSRKLQEAVLTMYLEQELTKEQIIELYLNVVEFGPMVYGVEPAARHYFSTSAKELSLGQALYIASIMPNPKVQHFGSGGAVAPGWMAYLHKLMKIARDRNRIADDEMEEGLRETVIRGSPAPQRSPKPANTGPIDPSAPALPYEPVEEWP